MLQKICPVCKTRFLSDDIFCWEDHADLRDHCNNINKKTRKDKKKKKLVRTSTPIADLEENPTSSLSDSVNDFFYQSWKSGLHLEGTATVQRLRTNWNYYPYTVLQPVFYAPQIVCVHTVIYQPHLPASYMHQVGYRPDGTFGLLIPTCRQ